MAKLPWIRLYTELLHDPKLRRLTTVEKWIWVGLLLLAGDSPERGRIYLADGVPFTNKDIADALNLCNSVEEDWDEHHRVEPAIETFRALKMIEVEPDGTLVVLNFDKRQYDSPSDHPAKVAERVKRHREKKRNDGVTEVKRECNALDTDTDTDTDTEKSVYTHWNGKDNLIKHRSMTQSMKKHISARLKDFSVEEITGAIDNYSIILAGDQYILNHKWTLAEFLTRAFDKFLAVNDPFSSYKKSGGDNERFESSSTPRGKRQNDGRRT